MIAHADMRQFLLVRPYPSLRILFASPALRVPGMLQSPFLSRIGGSTRVRDELTAALAAGRGVTAKVRWMTTPIGQRYNTPQRVSADNSSSNGTVYISGDEGRARWIHCTPLLGHNGAVGVWMVVLVDEDGIEPRRKYRMAPPVARDIASAVAQKKHLRPMSAGSEGDVESTMDIRGALNHGPERRTGSAQGNHARQPTKGRRSSTGHGHGGYDDRYETASIDTTVKVDSVRGAPTNRGAYAEWERKMQHGTDGDGSVRSFAI